MTGDRLTLEHIRRWFHDAANQEFEPSPVYLPPWLYDEAERLGHDMRHYRKVMPIPTEGLRNGRAR